MYPVAPATKARFLEALLLGVVELLDDDDDEILDVVVASEVMADHNKQEASW